MIELATHCLYVILIFRTILLSQKRKIGWLFAVTADLGWVIVGLVIGLYSMVMWSLVFATMDFRGYLKWRK